MKGTTMQTLKTSELRLGDIVKAFPYDDAFSTATVERIDKGLVHFFRPYVHTNDFSYTGGVMCYVGVEHFSVFQTSSQTFDVYRRVELR
jgi:hypothetical protein